MSTILTLLFSKNLKPGAFESLTPRTPVKNQLDESQMVELQLDNENKITLKFVYKTRELVN